VRTSPLGEKIRLGVHFWQEKKCGNGGGYKRKESHNLRKAGGGQMGGPVADVQFS